MRSSGSEAPCRKLNADDECSSTYTAGHHSVENRVDEPAAGLAIEKHAVGGAVAERDVPLVVIPSCLSEPPLAGGFPRPDGTKHCATGKAAPIRRDFYWT